ncbi:NAD(P)-binding domain-containing protein [Sinimarinibacterium sp. CAU 1509]|uniref:NAD(P)-binding domain-containing protein n=1 Tax=Sinimarinibacterium sp. CAU 1509 TaxID=2562283 RepID=UPI001B7FDEBE|nr:NAD(P)-binding domain-containing protein [Sinimarinibacterium sp. CAU 1509]
MEIGVLGWLVYGVPAAALLFLYGLISRRRDRRNLLALDAATTAGLTEPASLHPVIDPGKCGGCGACVSACPEGNVLGIIAGRAHLIAPTKCIGHGACRAACPYDAITLVFGTEKRGVEIPLLSPDFETNVPGIFIAGELGGMGLIRNAVTQGVQAMQAIKKSLGKHAHALDVLIVGAGPAGLAAALYAKSTGLRYRLIEQDTLGGTVAHFPRGKIVMTAPVNLPIVGQVRLRETTKEHLMRFWLDACATAGITIQEQERAEAVHKLDDGFLVKTTRGEHKTARVLLAIGRRGTPRTLGVPGENASKVVYRLIDPAQYAGRHVLVVGGGDAALEAAVSIADQPDSQVTLSYRGEAFARAKPKNRERVEAAQRAGRLLVMLGSEVREIMEDSVRLETGGVERTLRNDTVIVCAGGVLPTPFLKQMGIDVETKYGTA